MAGFACIYGGAGRHHSTEQLLCVMSHCDGVYQAATRSYCAVQGGEMNALCCKAILERKVIRFYYDGGYRFAEPHCYGG